MRGSRRYVAVAAALMVVLAGGCGVALKQRYSRLSPEDQAQYAGTQTGFHRLSDYFAVIVSGGAVSPRVMEFYYYPDGGGRKLLIGTITAYLYDSADYGPREQHFESGGEVQPIGP